MMDEWYIDVYSPWIRIPTSLLPAGLIFLWLIEDMRYDYRIAGGYGVFAFIFGYLFWGWLADHDKRVAEECVERYREIPKAKVEEERA